MKHPIYLYAVPLLVAYLHFLGFAPPGLHSAFGDPDYGYLLNALMITQGQPPNHIDHPGTTVQLIGALTIWILHHFHFPDLPLVDSVLLHPYAFAKAYSSALVGILALSTLLFGFALRRARFPWWIAVAAQTIPFALPPAWYYLSRIAPENLLLSICLWIGTVFALNRDRKALGWMATLSLAVILGIGLATKITLVPLLGLLLLSRSWKKVIAGTIVAAATFGVFTFPIWSEYSRVFSWLFRIFEHQSNYGQGEKGVVPAMPLLRENFFLLWNDCLPFFYLFSLIPLAAILLIRERKITRSSFFVWLLAVSAALQLIQFLLVMKHPADRYLLPALATSLCLLPRLANLEISWWRKTPLLVAFASLLYVSINTGFERWYLVASNLSSAEQELIEYKLEIDKFKSCGKIFSSPINLPQFSLYSGDLAAGGFFTPDLQRLYPNTYFYDQTPGRIRSFGESVMLGEVQKQMKKASCVVLLGSANAVITGAFIPVITDINEVPVRLAKFEIEIQYEYKSNGIYLIKNFARK